MIKTHMQKGWGNKPDSEALKLASSFGAAMGILAAPL